jgi:thiol-disulfide isomerase/thioredoxin
MKTTSIYLSMILAISSVLYIAYAGSPVYVESLVDAMAESESTGKDIFVIFTADWCGACRVMKKDIDKNPQFLESYIVCMIDYDTNPDLIKEYGVRTIPDYFVLKNKKEIKRRKGYSNIIKLREWIQDDK